MKLTDDTIKTLSEEGVPLEDEFCHIAQINRMGGRKYWKRVVLGRFHPGSGGLLGKNLEEEKECYGIQSAYRTRNMKGKKR